MLGGSIYSITFYSERINYFTSGREYCFFFCYRLPVVILLFLFKDVFFFVGKATLYFMRFPGPFMYDNDFGFEPVNC